MESRKDESLCPATRLVRSAWGAKSAPTALITLHSLSLRLLASLQGETGQLPAQTLNACSRAALASTDLLRGLFEWAAKYLRRSYEQNPPSAEDVKLLFNTSTCVTRACIDSGTFQCLSRLLSQLSSFDRHTRLRWLTSAARLLTAIPEFATASYDEEHADQLAKAVGSVSGRTGRADTAEVDFYAALARDLLKALKDSHAMEHLARVVMLNVQDACAAPPPLAPTQIASSSSSSPPSSSAPEAAAASSSSAPAPSNRTGRGGDLALSFAYAYFWTLQAFLQNMNLQETLVDLGVWHRRATFGALGFSTQYLLATHALAQVVAMEAVLARKNPKPSDTAAAPASAAHTAQHRKQEAAGREESGGGSGSDSSGAGASAKADGGDGGSSVSGASGSARGSGGAGASAKADGGGSSVSGGDGGDGGSSVSGASGSARGSGGAGASAGDDDCGDGEGSGGGGGTGDARGSGSAGSSGGTNGSTGRGGGDGDGRRLLYGLDPALLPPAILNVIGGRPGSDANSLAAVALATTLRRWGLTLRLPSAMSGPQLISPRAVFKLCTRLARGSTESLHTLYGVQHPPWLRGAGAAGSDPAAQPAGPSDAAGADAAAFSDSIAEVQGPDGGAGAGPSTSGAAAAAKAAPPAPAPARERPLTQKQLRQMQQQQARQAKQAQQQQQQRQRAGKGGVGAKAAASASSATLTATDTGTFPVRDCTQLGMDALVAAASAWANRFRGTAPPPPQARADTAPQELGGAGAAADADGAAAAAPEEEQQEGDGGSGAEGSVSDGGGAESSDEALECGSSERGGEDEEVDCEELMRFRVTEPVQWPREWWEATIGALWAAAHNPKGFAASMKDGGIVELFKAIWMDDSLLEAPDAGPEDASTSASLRARFLDANMPMALPLGLVPCLEALVRRVIPDVNGLLDNTDVWALLVQWSALQPVLLRADPRQALAFMATVAKAIPHLGPCSHVVEVSGIPHLVSGIDDPLSGCLAARRVHPSQTPAAEEVDAAIAHCRAGMGCRQPRQTATLGLAAGAAGGSAGGSHQKDCSSSDGGSGGLDGVGSSAASLGAAPEEGAGGSAPTYLFASITLVRWLPGLVQYIDRHSRAPVDMPGQDVSPTAQSLIGAIFRVMPWVRVVCRAYWLAVFRGDAAAAGEWRQLLLGDVDVFGLMDMALEVCVREGWADGILTLTAHVAQALALFFPAEMAAASAPRSSRLLFPQWPNAPRGSKKVAPCSLRVALETVLIDKGMPGARRLLAPLRILLDLHTSPKYNKSPTDAPEVREVVAAMLAGGDHDGRDILRLVPPSALSAVLPVCANPRCANLAGDSEAELPLPVSCGGCGGAVRYCSKECLAAHARAGHSKEVCGALKEAAAAPEVAART